MKKKGIIIGYTGGFIWGMILAVVLKSFDVKNPFMIWQYWILVIYPVVVFIIAGIYYEKEERMWQ